MHVTFGSVLDYYEARLKSLLADHMDMYERYLQIHFERHLEPFVKK